jgi:hypothetical protein
LSKLVLFLADGTMFNIPLDRERITIGRRADNEVCLPNLAVSGEHAAIVTILADSFLEDLGSTNGTLVNGSPIVKHFLRDRDEIDVGRHKLVYCVDDDAVLAPEVVAGIARVTARDFGDRVETAKPPARSKRAASSPRSKRDAPAPAKEPAKEPATNAAHIKTRSPAKQEPPPPDVIRKPEVVADPVASIKLLNGPGAGRAIPITKEKTTIGRAGVQVALISQSGAGFRLQPLEGNDAPRVNGSPPAADGIELRAGDVLEIAGRKLEFIVTV